MLIKFQNDFDSLRNCLPKFLSLADEARWEKRVYQLREDFSASPFLAKIVSHYHWFEMALADQIEMAFDWSREKSSPDPQSLAALLFAQTIVEVYGHLSNTGKTSLGGRIRDSIKAETGFSALYLELNMARLLFEAGYEVEFSDLDGFGRYDLRFWNGRIEGEVECKSISTDAGRRIHRKDFYRFIAGIGKEITIRANSGANEVVVVTIDDRMPSDANQQNILRSATVEVLSRPSINGNFTGSFFAIEREPYELHLGSMGATPENLYKCCTQAYGENCHVSGVVVPHGCCLVVVRCRREDDHSAPLLEALKKAALQLSTTRPGFIAVQFDDIQPQDLLLPNLRRRVGILSQHLFLVKQAAHVLGTYFCPYDGLHFSENGVGAPAILIENPKPKFIVRKEDYPTFFRHIPDS